MKNEEKAALGTLFLILALAVIWTKQNIELMAPVLENSTLFFELILGALFIVAMRNLVGVKTFGVFGPVVVALGLKTSGLMWGVPLYLDLFIIGMITSFVIHPLALPGSFRVAVVQTIIAISLTVFELMGEVYHLTQFEMAIFFPVIVLSWLADRYVAQVVETGWGEPTKRLGGTVLVVILSQILIIQESLVTFVAMNPESWFFGLLLIILIARSTSLRFTELLRFKLVRDNEGKGTALGIDRRNRFFVAKYNPWSLFRFTTKVEMKRTLMQLEIPTPRSYANIRDRQDLHLLAKVAQKYPAIVIKPASGYGGEGILVLDKVSSEGEEPIFTAKDKNWTVDDLQRHILGILDGQYSGGDNDVAIIEKRVDPDQRIAPFVYGGLPDIRVIVLEGFPVMAMSRLPTKKSEGAANLHKGAIGLGLSLKDGSALGAVWEGQPIDIHPDTGADLREFKVPDWQAVLELAVRSQAASRLGYIGADIVLDEFEGPVLLEINKRPGLGIQNTNRSGLLHRLLTIEGLLPEHQFDDVSQRVKLSMELDERRWDLA